MPRNRCPREDTDRPVRTTVGMRVSERLAHVKALRPHSQNRLYQMYQQISQFRGGDGFGHFDGAFGLFGDEGTGFFEDVRFLIEGSNLCDANLSRLVRIGEVLERAAVRSVEGFQGEGPEQCGTLGEDVSGGRPLVVAVDGPVVEVVANLERPFPSTARIGRSARGDRDARRPAECRPSGPPRRPEPS